MLVKKTRISPILRRAILTAVRRKSTPRYPLAKPQLNSSFRGQPIFDVNLCIGCSLCSKDCPTKSIIMVTSEGKKYPQFHLDSCIFCYQCADSCPKKAIKTSTLYELATTDKSALVSNPQVCSIP